MLAPIRPALSVVAGPNGSGKTTTTQLLLKHTWAAGSLCINPDDIAQQQFGDWNSPQATLLAAQEATRLREACLAERRNFVFETVLSTDEKVAFIRKAREKGYFIRLFFVCTNDPKINLRRIAERITKGGHAVPAEKVQTRYYKALSHLAEAIPLVDRAYLYDNSIDGQQPTLLCRMVNGLIYKRYSLCIPDWAQAFCADECDTL